MTRNPGLEFINCWVNVDFKDEEGRGYTYLLHSASCASRYYDRPRVVLMLVRYFARCWSHPQLTDAQRQTELEVRNLRTVNTVRTPRFDNVRAGVKAPYSSVKNLLRLSCMATSQ